MLKNNNSNKYMKDLMGFALINSLISIVLLIVGAFFLGRFVVSLGSFLGAYFFFALFLFMKSSKRKFREQLESTYLKNDGYKQIEQSYSIHTKAVIPGTLIISLISLISGVFKIIKLL